MILKTSSPHRTLLTQLTNMGWSGQSRPGNCFTCKPHCMEFLKFYKSKSPKPVYRLVFSVIIYCKTFHKSITTETYAHFTINLLIQISATQRVPPSVSVCHLHQSDCQSICVDQAPLTAPWICECPLIDGHLYV